jgi:hypothetical protein
MACSMAICPGHQKPCIPSSFRHPNRPERRFSAGWRLAGILQGHEMSGEKKGVILGIATFFRTWAALS